MSISRESLGASRLVFKGIKSIKNGAYRGELARVCVEGFRWELKHGFIKSKSEVSFVEGLIKFYDSFGYLSDKQLDAARKTYVRLICSKSAEELFPLMA